MRRTNQVGYGGQMFIKSRLFSLLTVSIVFLVSCGGDSVEESTSAGVANTEVANTGVAAVDGANDPLTELAWSLEVSSSTLGAADPAFGQENVFDGFGCDGGNISPEVSWSAGPEGTKSYALVVFDEDAPTGVGFHHWVAVDIPASARSIPEGTASGTTNLPEGTIETRTDFGAGGYGGPCPPEGNTHDYLFQVYALDTDSLGVDAETSPAAVRFNIKETALAVGQLKVSYSR